MAQAVFEDHPLGDYLRDAGEVAEIMPGTSSEITRAIDPFVNLEIDEDELKNLPEWRPRLIIQFLDILYSISNLVQSTKTPDPFVERFKYDIISSSLLTTTLQKPPHRSVRTLPIPGRLPHSRTPSLESNPPPPVVPSAPQDSGYLTPSIIVTVAASFYLTGHIFMALLSLVAVAVALHSLYVMNDSSKLDMTPCLTSLNELIAASDAWGSIVQEAIANVEVEEESLLYGSTFSTSSPTSSTRVALHSSLLTTQTQCDNIRQLFSALTSATELSQLSEMYAPPPSKPTHPLAEANRRPLSLSASQRGSQRSHSEFNKRSTWNGSYTSLAGQVGPLPQVVRRRGRRRSDLTSLLEGPLTKEAQSAPVTPPKSPGASHSSRMPGQPPSPVSVEPRAENDETFGAAALGLHKSSRAEAADVFESFFAAPILSPPTSLTISSGSRLLPSQHSRHPLSFPALQTALHNAIASKRHACSHLLALRFSEDEDEGYWEDVRSVMGLLTTTFSDASSRLMQALERNEIFKQQDQLLTPLSESDDGFQDIRPSDISIPEGRTTSVDLACVTSFAPTPGPLTRFAAHVTAISSALEDAKENLEQCISVLKEEDPLQCSTPLRKMMEGAGDLDDEHHPALLAYERLRRELGLALRECARGQERLLEIVKPPADPAAHDSDSEDVPGLAHDASDESDKPGTHSLSDEEEGNRGAFSAFLDSKMNDGGELERDDDATQHLLLSASPQHLPPVLGVEQVFEAEAASASGFTRERSKLTREERIKFTKARRENVVTGRRRGSLSILREIDDGLRGGVERWGPGGEVVQELKDVIWKVSERRRKFADGLMRRQSLDLQDLQEPHMPAVVESYPIRSLVHIDSNSHQSLF